MNRNLALIIAGIHAVPLVVTVGVGAALAQAGAKAGSVKEAVATLKGAFEKKVATAESIIGTWVYKEPAVMTTSGPIIVRAIGNVSAGKLEKLLTNYFQKANITPENTYLTFKKDGTFRILFFSDIHCFLDGGDMRSLDAMEGMIDSLLLGELHDGYDNNCIYLRGYGHSKDYFTKDPKNSFIELISGKTVGLLSL